MTTELLEAYKESCEQAEKIIVKQTEQIASLQQQLALANQRILTEKKKLKLFKELVE